MTLSHSGRLVLTGAVLAAVIVAGVSGCGGQGSGVTVSDPGATSSAPSPTSSPTSGATNVTIALDDGAGQTSTWTLTCDDAGKAGGTHPHPDKACAALAKGGKQALPPVSKQMMCTQLYGGPQKAQITGTYLGQPVSSSLSRTNGCEISRWNALKGLLPAGPAGPQ